MCVCVRFLLVCSVKAASITPSLPMHSVGEWMASGDATPTAGLFAVQIAPMEGEKGRSGEWSRMDGVTDLATRLLNDITFFIAVNCRHFAIAVQRHISNGGRSQEWLCRPLCFVMPWTSDTPKAGSCPSVLIMMSLRKVRPFLRESGRVARTHGVIFTRLTTPIFISRHIFGFRRGVPLVTLSTEKARVRRGLTCFASLGVITTSLSYAHLRRIVAFNGVGKHTSTFAIHISVVRAGMGMATYSRIIYCLA